MRTGIFPRPDGFPLEWLSEGMQVSRMERENKPVVKVFWCAFVFACVLFWWLPSILFRLVLKLPDVVSGTTLWISVAALAAFSVGYIVPVYRRKRRLIGSEVTLDLCESLTYKLTILLFPLALVGALHFLIYRAGVAYGEGEGIPLWLQAILYTHLFFGLMFLGIAGKNEVSHRRIWIAAFLTTLPRLLVSLHWGRFFFAQALVPIIFIAIARGWLRMGRKWLIYLPLLAAAIVFVPAITRGTKVAGEDASGRSDLVTFFQQGSVLVFFEKDRDLVASCPPIAVSFLAKTVPFKALGICTMRVGNQTGVLADITSLLTARYSDDLMAGTGGIYILELFLVGGVPAIIIGSVMFGISCRWFIEALAYRSLFVGIWAECISRALFAPRGTLGYVYERIPSLVLSTIAVVVLAHLISVISAAERARRVARPHA